MRILLALVLLLAGMSTQARGGQPNASAEIDALFSALAGSGCEFNRNGSWHAAGEARAHLERKYSYLQKRRLVTSAESFIELAASKSSMSGKPYLVRCGKAAPVRSRGWFLEQLRRIRAGSAHGANNSSKPTPLRGAA